MTDELELLKSKLRDIVRRQENEDPDSDPEMDHVKADELLLEYINDSEVSELFNSIDKWYD